MVFLVSVSPLREPSPPSSPKSPLTVDFDISAQDLALATIPGKMTRYQNKVKEKIIPMFVVSDIYFNFTLFEIEKKKLH